MSFADNLVLATFQYNELVSTVPGTKVRQLSTSTGLERELLKFMYTDTPNKQQRQHAVQLVLHRWDPLAKLVRMQTVTISHKYFTTPIEGVDPVADARRLQRLAYCAFLPEDQHAALPQPDAAIMAQFDRGEQ